MLNTRDIVIIETHVCCVQAYGWIHNGSRNRRMLQTQTMSYLMNCGTK